MTPLEYIQKRGWEHKAQRDQWIVKTCPRCGDSKWHFALSQAEGLYSCWICNCRGTLKGLMRDMGDEEPAAPKEKSMLPPVNDLSILKYHQAFLESQEAKDYITSRGISVETATKYQLCYKKGFVGIPSFRTGKCVVIKWRTLPPAKKGFLREPAGAESILYNEDAFSLPGKEIIVTEGEIDCLTLLDRGIKNAVSVPNGAASVDVDWVRKLRKKKKVYLAFDPDLAGQRGMENLAAQVGEGKCYRVSLPGEDINEFLSTRSVEEFNKFLDSAEPFGKPNVVDFDWVFDERAKMMATGEGRGLTIHIPPVAAICGPLLPGNVYILSAYPKVGKTVLSMNIAWHFARNGLPILFYCLEMSPLEIADMLLCHEYPREAASEKRWQTGIGQIGAKPFFYGWNPKPLKWQDTFDVIRQECRDRGIRFLVIDNFHYLCRAEKDIIGVEGVVSREIKLLAGELGIPIWLIVHPRKKDGQLVEEKMPTFHDLRGTSALAADASAVMVLHRKMVGEKKEEEVECPRSPLGMIRNDAARFGTGGARKIWFDGATRTFREVLSVDDPGWATPALETSQSLPGY